MIRWMAILLTMGAGLSIAATAHARLRVTVEPSSPAPAQVFRVRAEGEASKSGSSVELRLGGHVFALWPVGAGAWEGLAVLDRDETAGLKELLVVAVGPDGEALLSVEELTVAERDYGVQELKVDERMVTLSPEDEKRAERENRLIRSVLAGVSRERLWSLPFSYPVPGKISGPFGVRRVFNGKPRNYHGGIDMAAPRGAPVVAAAGGRVALTGNFFFTGNTVLLDHGFGLFTAYFHMDSVAVVEGEAVEPGVVLGLVGSTGRSTGPHLHWSVYVAGVRADPVSLVDLPGSRGGGGERP